MKKIEIDISEEIEKAIEKEVVKQLDNGGLLSFIRRCVKNEFVNSGSFTQLKRHESQIMQIKRKLNTSETKPKTN